MRYLLQCHLLALYSMCAGKPVIIVNLENTVNYSEYKNSNAVWEANSSLELRNY